MSGRAFALALICCVVAAAPAAAQITRTVPPAGIKREISIGGVFSGPSSMGSANADLLNGNGQPVPQFSTHNSMSAGFGPELLLGFRAKPALWLEVGGSLTWPSLRTTIEGDIEGAEPDPLTSRVTRWSVEGALVWWIKDKDKTTWFIRAGGGVAGEVSQDESSSATAALGTGGVGVRHWFRESKGGLRKMGLRAEFRGVVQSGGLSFNDRTIRFTPTGTVHLVFGY